MTQEVTPIYLDWTFWAVVVAAIAVVLSQIPPIHQLIKKAKLDFELFSKISLTHKIGNPNLQFHIFITNIGGRRIRIKGIDAIIERDGENLTTLPAQNYLQNPSDKNTVLFTNFSLNPGQDWGYIVNLLNFFGRQQENRYRGLEANILADYREKRSVLRENGNELIEVNRENYEPFIDFFNEQFIWLPGEYRLTIRIKTDQKSANISKSFRFTIFESHCEQLREVTDSYKYGTGIWWDSDKILNSVIIDVSEA